jgi:hypothetical protein
MVGVPETRPHWLRELEQSPASQWVRCALQVNPYQYTLRHGIDSGSGTEDDYNRRLVEALTHAGVQLISVTDHFRIADSQTLLDEARSAGMVALPGFEASTVEGIHFLVVFPDQCTVGDVERCIGKCQVRDTDAPSPQGGLSALELLELCATEKLACIAAHVTRPNGLLEHAAGQARLSIWKSEHLHGVTIPGAVNKVPAKYRSILTNEEKSYERDRLPAILNAADVSSPGAASAKGTSCMLRMSSPSQAALRHALLDPESRVRLDSDKPRPARPCLVGIHWEGGLLDGQTIPLAEELNVLIGAPGAGKSTVIESLRSAFELTPSSRRGQEDLKDILSKVLRNGTTVSVVIDHPLPTPVRYVVERQLPNPSVVRNADSWSLSDRGVADLAPVPQIYGQHEIADLATDELRRTELLLRFVRETSERQAEYAQVVEDLETSRIDVDRCASAVETLEAELSLLPGARERLKLFQDAKVAERLTEQTVLDREHRVITGARKVLDSLSNELSEFVRGVPENFEVDSTLASSPFLPQLQKLAKAVGKPIGTVRTQVTQLEAEIVQAHETVEEIFAEWKVRRGEADAALQEVKTQLEEQNIDHEVYREVQGRVDTLSAMEPDLNAAKSALSRAVAARKKLLVKRESLENQTIRDLQRAAGRVSGLLSPSVRIEVVAAVDHGAIEETLRSSGGRLNESLTIFRDAADFSPRALAQAAREGPQALEARWSLPSQQAARIAGLDRPTLFRLEETRLRTSTRIFLNTAPEGAGHIWTSIEDLSKGQKAIAVLLLLLLDSDAPLIVDQPEDDLDNRFISSQVVPAVREAKHRRQFVFSTHNANVPVLSDAELVVGLTGDEAARRARVLDGHMGAVDAPSVRSLIEQRLEGGRDAFEARRRRYRLD